MTIGSGIAVAAMWLAVTVVALKDPGAAVVLGFFAVMATMVVA